jgi:hypothetical protein
MALASLVVVPHSSALASLVFALASLVFALASLVFALASLVFALASLVRTEWASTLAMHPMSKKPRKLMLRKAKPERNATRFLGSVTSKTAGTAIRICAVDTNSFVLITNPFFVLSEKPLTILPTHTAATKTRRRKKTLRTALAASLLPLSHFRQDPKEPLYPSWQTSQYGPSWPSMQDTVETLLKLISLSIPTSVELTVPRHASVL